MKKRYLLLFCLSFLCSHKIWADVGSIQIRLNENMQVVDLATSSVSTSTIDEVFVQQGGLTTAGNTDKFDENGKLNDPNDVCPAGFGKKCDETETNCFCCQDGNVCLDVDNDNRCYEDEIVMLRPVCGCPDGEYPWNDEGTSRNEDNPAFCCDTVGAYISVKNNDGTREKLRKTDVDVQFYCGACPKDSIIFGDTTCCNTAGEVYQGGTWIEAKDTCGCAIADTETRNKNCQTQEKCENTQGMKWCEACVCMPQEATCPCVPGSTTSPCTVQTCTTQGGCWIDNSCAAQDPNKSCEQRQCEEEEGKKWCGEEGCLDECTCTPGADENGYCIQETCEAANGCWYNGTCKAKGTCSADQSWDENICACAAPCPSDTKRTEEGDCIPCPTGGEVTGDAGDYVCCDKDKKWYTEGAWSESPNYAKCGCPEGQYLEGNECFSCTSNTHCSDEGKVCDIDGDHTCVECIDNYDCSGDKVCNDEKKCACPEGEHWNESTSSCVECDGNYGTAATWPCSSDKPLCNSGVCEACTTADSTKPYWNNGKCVECTENDPCSDGVCQTETNTCVQCLTDDNCSNNPNKKHCVNNQCVQCTETEHCEKGLCVGNKCVACTTGKECQAGEWCDLENGLCVAGCNTTMKQDETNNTCYCDKTKDPEDPSKDSKTPVWDAWRNRCVSCFRYNDKKPFWNGTECVECGPIAEGSDRLKVWDLYNEKCVRCYDSISANWTDLGCGSTVWHSSYEPRQEKWSTGDPIIGRVCKVDTTNTDNNKCVQCTEDSHCPTNKKCKNNTCMECDADYGATTGLRCPNTKPQCSDGVCTACQNDKKYWYNGECVACSRHYGVAGDGYECPSGAPYCDKGTCKTCTQVGAKTDVGPTTGSVKTKFGTPARDPNFRGCYLCINDKTGESKEKWDSGCTPDNPICPTASGKGYNVCCSTDAPKWKDGKCVTCAAVDSKKPLWNGSACVQCIEDNDCGKGKYCNNNGTCVACTKGTRCGCAEYQCANGEGGCYSQLAWCMKWNANYSHKPSDNKACSGFACCNHNSKEDKWDGKNPPACKTDTSINGQNRTS